MLPGELPKRRSFGEMGSIYAVAENLHKAKTTNGQNAPPPNAAGLAGSDEDEDAYVTLEFSPTEKAEFAMMKAKQATKKASARAKKMRKRKKAFQQIKAIQRGEDIARKGSAGAQDDDDDDDEDDDDDDDGAGDGIAAELRRISDIEARPSATALAAVLAEFDVDDGVPPPPKQDDRQAALAALLAEFSDDVGEIAQPAPLGQASAGAFFNGSVEAPPTEAPEEESGVLYRPIYSSAAVAAGEGGADSIEAKARMASAIASGEIDYSTEQPAVVMRNGNISSESRAVSGVFGFDEGSVTSEVLVGVPTVQLPGATQTNETSFHTAKDAKVPQSDEAAIASLLAEFADVKPDPTSHSRPPASPLHASPAPTPAPRSTQPTSAEQAAALADLLAEQTEHYSGFDSTGYTFDGMHMDW